MKLSFTRALFFFLALFTTRVVCAATAYEIDVAHSRVGFSIRHMMISDVEGKFGNFTGEIQWDTADSSKSSIQGSIKTDSIDTDNEKRDGNLKGAEFFDAAKFPEITFKTKKIEKRGDQFVATGDLTMKGVTKEVQIPFSITAPIKDPFGAGMRIGLKGSMVINRKDYGISWNKVMDSGGVMLGDEVTVQLSAEALQK